MAKPKNIEELRDGLLEAYEWVKADPRRAHQVKEMVNAAGKVIGSLKVELEYAMLRGATPNIGFLGGDLPGSGKLVDGGIKRLQDKRSQA